MRTKDEILKELHFHMERLDPQHKELALVASIETEVQIDIRDILDKLVLDLYQGFRAISKTD